jgi:ribosome-associated toxin RatA of RatAB toxin-antitoxin module
MYMADSFLEVLGEENSDRGRKCNLEMAFKRMEPEFRTEVQIAMNSPEISAAAISRTLKRFDFNISEGSIRRCRTQCSCWKVTE